MTNKPTLINRIKIPFVILYIRYIQWRMKKISIKHSDNRTNSNLSTLIVLQAIEDYYRKQFDSWGKYHCRFSYSYKEHKKHLQNLEWLFPEKDYEEWDIVICHKDRAITYYHNKIFNLTKGRPPLYYLEILKQIKDWKEAYNKDF